MNLMPRNYMVMLGAEPVPMLVVVSMVSFVVMMSTVMSMVLMMVSVVMSKAVAMVMSNVRLGQCCHNGNVVNDWRELGLGRGSRSFILLLQRCRMSRGNYSIKY